MMNYIVPTAVVVMIGGMLIAPPYQYNSREIERLASEPSLFADHILWPIRAYQNWKSCGTVSYCEKYRCARLRGGCPNLRTTRRKPLAIDEQIIVKGIDPSLGPIGKVDMDVQGNDKHDPQVYRKFREMVEAKERIPSPAKESQRKIIHDKLKEVGDVWKGINLGEPKKRYVIGELPELRKSIAKEKSVSSQPPQSSEIAGQKSKVPWGPLIDSRSWPPNNTVPQKPKAARQGDDSEPQNAKDTVDLKTFQNDAFGAYSKALAEGKFTVIQFGSGYCGFCKNLIKKLGDPALAKYADRVVVSDTDGDVDPGARQLEIALGVVRYPTLVVLKTNSKNIHVAGRIEGEVSISEIDRIFQEAMKEPIGK